MTRRSPSANPRMRLRISPAAEAAVRGGHPWIFADSIRDQNRPGLAGELAVIFDRKDRFLALGLFDPESPLRVRVVHTGKPVAIDPAWWRRRLQAALERRRGLFDDRTNGYRWIHGESDGWPGLVLDRYGAVLVLKCYTAAWLPRLAEVVPLLGDALQPTRLVLRLSRNLQSLAKQRFRLAEGQELDWQRGAMPLANAGRPTVEFLESGLRFEADVVRGQKTGFFLDQRDNRRRIELLAPGRHVLNAFSYSGGFSLYAARGGATSVTDLDLSAHALAAGDRNFALNRREPAVAACPRTAIQADAFAWLAQNPPRRFDLVMLDPPSLARRESERAGAIQAYERLAANGLHTLRPGGVLAAASCSAHVTKEEFFNAVRRAAQRANRRVVELETTEHPPDHPAAFAEARYLKCIYLRA